MSGGWVLPDAVFDGGRLQRGVGLRLERGQVVEVGPAPQTAARMDGIVVPGFVDLQVNGGGGVLLNNDPSADGMRAIAAAHAKFGTVAVMPTVITDAPDVMVAATEAALEVAGQGGVIGLHIEGPHIALAKRGTHAAVHIRPLDETILDCIARLRAADVPVMLTVAPEVVTPSEIAELAAQGVVVSIGHTDASAGEAEAAIAAGAQAATHLYNAMSQMTARAPGVVGAVLNADIAAGIICDGHHVDDRLVRLAFAARCLPFLVSDAMATVGGPEAFSLYGNTIRVDGGRLINAEGNLAGAHTTMAEGLARLVGPVGIDLETALCAVLERPARLIGRADLALIQGRSVSECLLIDAAGCVTGSLGGI